MAFLFLLQLAVLYLPLAAATCYYPDGSIEPSTDYQPCVATVGVFSMCCATNRTQFPDQCLPSGLCHNPCATSGFCGDSTGGQYWRESCTDPTWSSPFCLKNVCADPGGNGGNANSTAAVSLCVADGTWCCGGDVNATACCAPNVNRVAIAATVGVSTSSITSTSISSSSASSSSTYNPTTTDTGPSVSASATKAASSSNNNGQKIGIGVGVGVGATCLIAAAVIIYIFLRRRKGGKEYAGPVQSGDIKGYYSQNASPKTELETEPHERSELGSGNHYQPDSGNVVYHEVHG